MTIPKPIVIKSISPVDVEQFHSRHFEPQAKNPQPGLLEILPPSTTPPREHRACRGPGSGRQNDGHSTPK
jgi:hypothetical protein